MAKRMTQVTALMLLLSPVSSLSNSDKLAHCNHAMLNDFDSMSQDEMMECAVLLEDPLMQLEEETMAREAAEKEAAAALKAEAARKAIIEGEARRKREIEATEIAKQKHIQREKQAGMVKGLQQELASCNIQYESAVVGADSLSQCQHDLNVYQTSSVPVDPRIKPLFGSRNLEVVVLPILAVFSILFWLLGCCMGTSKVTPLLNPSEQNAGGVVISEVSIRPGSEIVVITNKTFNDMDMSGCSLRVASASYSFNDGYNLAKGTFVEVHSGPEAKSIKKLPISENDKFDSRRCNTLFWTSSSVFLGTGETSASLLDANDHVLSTSN